MKHPRTFGAAFAAVLIVLGDPSVFAEDGFSEADQNRAHELVRELEAGDFADRASAAAKLEDLPFSALPWLEAMIGTTKRGDAEVHTRLKSIIQSIKIREAERVLREGTQVKIDLKAARPEDVLEALKKEIGSSLTSVPASGIWEVGTDKDFSFEGSYWEAVDAMMKAYPPKKLGREDLGGEYDIARWGEHDFGASESAHIDSGILRVRNGRIALENSGWKDYLVVTLVPSVEPAYQVEELTLNVEGLTLESGELIEPEKISCEWKAGSRGVRYNPSTAYSWVFPLKKGMDLRGSARLDGIAKIRVRRFIWEEVEMPEDLAGPVDMNPNVKFSVLERAPGQLKIQFEGAGSRPVWAAHYELRKEGYELLDKDGEVLDFKVSRSSSSGSNGWRVSYEGSIEGEPAQVRAKLRSAEQELELKFDLADLPMPGSSLVD